ncbi:glycosyltransferase [Xylophilus rhododendri]|uniref:Glycosyltransferase n=1 Tax=Xylophilus rhododendri TaxID=2697032 RepID=A0A857J6H4_9BURK|nr:glycosyltransferase [Xylophilus rhododendri]QHI98621.1 glycosyltransferase [Xylophilus rhododendri]
MTKFSRERSRLRALLEAMGWAWGMLGLVIRRAIGPRKALVAFSAAGSGTGWGGDLRSTAMSAALGRMGWETCVFHPKIGARTRKLLARLLGVDIVFLQQTRSRHNDPALYSPVPCVLDVDDADIINPTQTQRIGAVAKGCVGVVAGSRYNAKLFAPWNSTIRVIWTGTYLRQVEGAKPNGQRARVVAWAPSDPFGYPAERQFIQKVVAAFPANANIEFRIYGVPEARSRELLDAFAPFDPHGFVRTMPFMPYSKFVDTLGEVAVGLQPICAEHEYSLGKSFGKVLAYLAADVAIVAADAIDHPLFFKDGVNGRLLPLDAQAWCDAAMALLDEPARRQEIVNAARASFLARLTTEAAAAQLAPLLSATLAKKPWPPMPRAT